MFKTTFNRTIKTVGKTFTDIGEDVSKKITEAFEHADKAFDAADEAFESAFKETKGTQSLQNEHMNIKVEEKTVTINGDVGVVLLNGKNIYTK